MTKIILSLIIALATSPVSLLSQSNEQKKPDAILGEWTNPAKDAKFEIYKKGDVYFGKIIWGTGGDTKDAKNPDPKLRSRDLVGLTILSDFTFDGDDQWEDGTIYDPKDGKTYSCVLTLVSSDKLDVRGFLGISLFGRTETWTRIN